MICSVARPSSTGGSQGGMWLVSQDRPNGWGIELTRFHGTNVVSCEIIAGRIRTPLVGAYLLPSTLNHLPDLEEDLYRFQVLYPIFIGDLNIDLDAIRSPRIPRSHLMADLLVEFVPVDLVQPFCQRLRF